MGRESHELKLRGGEEGRRARRPARTLKCVLVMLSALGGQHVPWYAIRCHGEPFVPSDSDREMALLVEGNQLHKLPRNSGFCLTTRIRGNGVSFGPNTRDWGSQQSE